MQHDENQSLPRRLTAMLAVTAAIALLTSGCGGGGTPTDAAGSSTSPTRSSPATMALAYAQCVRSHGVPKYPDPTINGNSINNDVNVKALGVSQTVLQAAQKACESLSPRNFVPPGLNQAQNTAQAEKWAQCMRKQGVPDFPDPTGDGSFNVPASINVQGSAFKAASSACQSVQPRSLRISEHNPGSS